MKPLLLLLVFALDPVPCLRLLRQTYDARAASACSETRGSYTRQGLLGMYTCVHAYGDGGRQCQSSQQCQGDCLVYDAQAGTGSARLRTPASTAMRLLRTSGIRSLYSVGTDVCIWMGMDGWRLFFVIFRVGLL